MAQQLCNGSAELEPIYSLVCRTSCKNSAGIYGAVDKDVMLLSESVLEALLATHA